MPYFDHNATSPLRDCARAAWLGASAEAWANPSALYTSGARAKLALEGARKRVAAILNCEPGRIVFTGCATESNNAVMRRFAAEGHNARCAVSAIEHTSVLEPARAIFGERLTLLPVDASGCVDVARAAEIIYAERPAIVSVMAANSETGVLQPWMDIAGICREAGIAFHCDAVQWLGRLPVGDMARRCDYLTFSAHKLGGPRGVGILVAPAADSQLHAQYGGHQESNRRAGTENVAAIVAAAAALEAACAEVADGRAAQQAVFRAAFEERMEKLGARLAGCEAPRLPQTSMLLMPRHANTRWVLRLAKMGFEAGTGSACGSGVNGPSHVLTAMGIEAAQAQRSVRVSACTSTDERDWAALAAAIEQVGADLDSDSGAANVVSI
jgi:cysteine desulfurase